MLASRKDLLAFKGQKLTQTWYIDQVVDGVIIPYDLTGKTVALKLFDRADPANEVYSKDPVSLGDGFGTFELLKVETESNEILDYQVIETIGADTQLLAYGTLTFVNPAKYIPFRDIVTNETPGGLTIPENYITIKAFEWRLFLQNAVEPAISDEDVSNEAAWPTLVNILIAKLVVHDYISKSLKGLLAKNDANDEANAAGVKKIETGPSNAEFFDSVNSMANFLKVDSNGNTPLNTLAVEICQLAKRLEIYLPICKNMHTDPIVYLRAGRPEVLDEIAILTKYYS